ncbi:MAG TPA: hypothetical protein VHO25_07870 [Polyangiaceae bacterium]|nr:hypothetical protein [Polyangiaceae bacterium]
MAVIAVSSCSEDDEDTRSSTPLGAGDRPPEQTGSMCESNDDCFPGVAEGGLRGDALCLTRVRDGYCTHTCEADDDCCAVPGECRTDWPQVCSPFESTGMMMCFLSCEAEDIAGDSGAADEQAFCQRYASPDFICRSSGGGTENRKICVPGDCGVGADCSSDTDCNGLECISDFRGGYCGRRDCTSNDDCPGDTSCVVAADGHNYCLKNCGADSDCSFCRHDGVFASCSTDVDFIDAGMSTAVCLPTLL